MNIIITNNTTGMFTPFVWLSYLGIVCPNPPRQSCFCLSTFVNAGNVVD